MFSLTHCLPCSGSESACESLLISEVALLSLSIYSSCLRQIHLSYLVLFFSPWAYLVKSKVLLYDNFYTQNVNMLFDILNFR